MNKARRTKVNKIICDIGSNRFEKPEHHMWAFFLHVLRAGWFYVKLTQATVTREEGASVEKMSSQDQAVGKPAGHFLSD